MRDALCKAGRPVVFSLCEWGKSKPWLWARDVGHLWRTTGDITALFEGEQDMGNWSKWGVMTIADMQKDLRRYAGPGHWNDPDMLEVGNGMTVGEDRAHFSIWCMMAAPLMAGNDLAGMSAETKAILTNREVIAVDQDPLGVQGFVWRKKEKLETWVKPLKDRGLVVCFLNRGKTPRRIDVRWNGLSIADDVSKQKYRFGPRSVYSIRDLWAGKEIGTTAQPLKAVLPGRDVLMLKFSRTAP
jgi:alpha-galactosidase